MNFQKKFRFRVNMVLQIVLFLVLKYGVFKSALTVLSLFLIPSIIVPNAFKKTNQWVSSNTNFRKMQRRTGTLTDTHVITGPFSQKLGIQKLNESK